MGTFANESMLFNNNPSPTTAVGLSQMYYNQVAIKEMPGASAPALVEIVDGSLSPTSAFVRVDTEGQAPADDLVAISTILSNIDSLHDGMLLYLQAADQDRVVTVKNTASVNGIQTFDGQDVELTATTWLPLQLQGERWVEVFGTRMQEGLEAIQDANVIATTSLAGKVKPDGTTIEVAADGTISSKATGRNIGEVFYSLVPLVDAAVHLLNGGIIYANGVYSKFVEYMAGLYNDGNHSTLFCTETQFQQSISDYGVCGKFVYDSVAGTLRLPKVTGFMQGTVVESAIGDLVEAGLPNITGEIKYPGLYSGQHDYDGAFTDGGQSISYITTDSRQTGIGISFDASRSNPIYGNSSTVQPQAIKGYVYIVLANAAKTQVEVDINEIATDLNGKADVDLTNCTKPHIVETWNSGTEWYRVWSDGWIEQGGETSNFGNTTTTVNLQKSFSDTNYTVTFSVVYSGGSSGLTNAAWTQTKNTSSIVFGSSITATKYLSWYACGY